jgi:hypothetical protein
MATRTTYDIAYRIVPLTDGLSWTFQYYPRVRDGALTTRWLDSWSGDTSGDDKFYLKMSANTCVELSRSQAGALEYVLNRHPRIAWPNKTIIFSGGQFTLGEFFFVNTPEESKRFDGFDAAFQYYKSISFQNMIPEWAKLTDAEGKLMRKCERIGPRPEPVSLKNTALEGKLRSSEDIQVTATGFFPVSDIRHGRLTYEDYMAIRNGTYRNLDGDLDTGEDT